MRAARTNSSPRYAAGLQVRYISPKPNVAVGFHSIAPVFHSPIMLACQPKENFFIQQVWCLFVFPASLFQPPSVSSCMFQSVLSICSSKKMWLHSRHFDDQVGSEFEGSALMVGDTAGIVQNDGHQPVAQSGPNVKRVLKFRPVSVFGTSMGDHEMATSSRDHLFAPIPNSGIVIACQPAKYIFVQ